MAITHNQPNTLVLSNHKAILSKGKYLIIYLYIYDQEFNIKYISLVDCNFQKKLTFLVYIKPRPRIYEQYLNGSYMVF